MDEKITRELSFTKQEADSLLNLIDVATKAQGLKAVNDALYFVNKLQNAFKDLQQSEETTKKIVQKKKKKSNVDEKGNKNK